jgi:hypothetical protein
VLGRSIEVLQRTYDGEPLVVSPDHTREREEEGSKTNVVAIRGVEEPLRSLDDKERVTIS